MPKGCAAGEDSDMYEVGGEAERCAFLSNDFLVLLSVARDPDMRVRDVARTVGITERATLAILRHVCDQGYLERLRVGRRTHYRVCRDVQLRHPLVAKHTVGRLIDALEGGAIERPPPPRLVY
jgi:hypothetical protein